MAIRPVIASEAAADRSSAWPLAWAWIALIVYASWHPFTGWRWPTPEGLASLPSLLWLPPPHHSSRFDVWSNFAGYVPLGALLGIAGLRDLPPGPGARRAAWLAVARAGAAAVLLSLLMEWGQNLLPQRVPSRVDWALNSAGGLLGASLAMLADRLGALQWWHIRREQWFVPHGSLGLALLLTWPLALLFPPTVPLALGQVAHHLVDLVTGAVAGSTWSATVTRWLPTIDPDASLSPGAEMICTTLGALSPCLVAYCMTRQTHHRLVLMVGSLLLGVVATALSTALNFGPEHAWAWITPPVPPALLLAGIFGFGLAWMHHRLVAAIGLVCVSVGLFLTNQAGSDPYFALSLHAWEQGRFVRFHGLSQWLGWFWPLGALIFLAMRLATRHPQRSPDGVSTMPT